MNGNLAFQEEPRDELLNGKIVMMASPSVNHNIIAFNITRIFNEYLKGKPCRAFNDGVDVYLTEKDRVIPDAMIICNKDIIKLDGIHGAPDLIVEILSPSTAKYDKGYKRDLYENAGIKEYWIVDPNTHSIEAYLLSEGKYRLNDFYAVFPDTLKITEKDREESKKEIPVSLFSGFCIPLEEIFQNLF